MHAETHFWIYYFIKLSFSKVAEVKLISGHVALYRLSRFFQAIEINQKHFLLCSEGLWVITNVAILPNPNVLELLLYFIFSTKNLSGSDKNIEFKEKCYSP